MTSTIASRIPRTAAAATLVLLLLVFLSPTVAAQDLGATRAAGEGGLLSAPRGVIRFNPAPGAITLDVSAASGEAVLVDEVLEDGVFLPSSQNALMANSARRSSTEPMVDGTVVATLARDPDAVIIVSPVDGGTHDAQVTTIGGFAVEPVDAQVLERSHHASNATIGTTDFRYYEYAIPESLRWAGSGQTEVHVEGEFDVYLWGIEFTLASPAGTTHHTTGYSQEPGAPPAPGAPSATRSDHYKYAVLRVRGGAMDLVVDSQQVEVFSGSFASEPEEVTFHGSEGTVPGRGGTFTTEGAVTARQGAYTLTYKPGGIFVDVTRAPASASGAYVSFTPDPWTEAGWLQPVLASTFAAVALAASAYSYPTLTGARQLRRMESLTGLPRPRGWVAARAEGYCMMAARAEDQGALRRAVLWMWLATRLDPHDPRKRLDLGIFQAARGKPAVALRQFQRAHVGLLEAGDLDDVAHNAYEAARAAASVDDVTAAVDWLRIAIQADAALGERAGLDPCFAALRDHEDYRSLQGA